MFCGERLRVIHIVAGRSGVGRTTVAVNLGAALARAGRTALLVDCVADGASGRALAYLGLRAGPGAGAPALGARAVLGPHGLAVLPLDLGAAAGRGIAGQAETCAALLAYAAPFDFVLVNSASSASVSLLPLDPKRCEVVVVLAREASSITEAYALIKRMSAIGAGGSFHILVNRVGSDAEARLIYQNMARVARGYLDVHLDLLGFIPADPAIERAAERGRSVIDCVPSAPATGAFRRLADDLGGWQLTRPRRAGGEPRPGVRAGQV